MKIAIVGSRNFKDYNTFKKIIDNIISKFENVEFVSGGAKGADEFAYKYAKENSIPIKIYFPNWEKYEKAAGYKRNKQIWQEADIGIAFWDGKSKGTTHSFDLAKEMNKKLSIYNFVQKGWIRKVF